MQLTLAAGPQYHSQSGPRLPPIHDQLLQGTIICGIWKCCLLFMIRTHIYLAIIRVAEFSHYCISFSSGCFPCSIVFPVSLTVLRLLSDLGQSGNNVFRPGISTLATLVESVPLSLLVKSMLSLTYRAPVPCIFPFRPCSIFQTFIDC